MIEKSKKKDICFFQTVNEVLQSGKKKKKDTNSVA
jgi:hypothetical protein